MMTTLVAMTHDAGDLLWERRRRARFEAALSWAGPAAVRPLASARPRESAQPLVGATPHLRLRTPARDPLRAGRRLLFLGTRTRDPRRPLPPVRTHNPRWAGSPTWSGPASSSRPEPLTRWGSFPRAAGRSCPGEVRSGRTSVPAPGRCAGGRDSPREGGPAPRRCRPAKCCSPS